MCCCSELLSLKVVLREKYGGGKYWCNPANSVSSLACTGHLPIAAGQRYIVRCLFLKLLTSCNKQVYHVVPHPRTEFDDCTVYCHNVQLIAVTSHACPFLSIRHAYVSCCCILKYFPFRQSSIKSLLLSLVDRSLYPVYVMRYICAT